ncbi:hypothetical protein D3C85_1204480 [compost metagenome]
MPRVDQFLARDRPACDQRRAPRHVFLLPRQIYRAYRHIGAILADRGKLPAYLPHRAGQLGLRRRERQLGIHAIEFDQRHARGDQIRVVGEDRGDHPAHLWGDLHHVAFDIGVFGRDLVPAILQPVAGCGGEQEGEQGAAGDAPAPGRADLGRFCRVLRGIGLAGGIQDALRVAAPPRWAGGAGEAGAVAVSYPPPSARISSRCNVRSWVSMSISNCFCCRTWPSADSTCR